MHTARVNLRNWLYDQRMTQNEFAGLIGATGTAVSDWLNGKRKPGALFRELIEIGTVGRVAWLDWESRGKATRFKERRENLVKRLGLAA